jgi:hypothetical protein
MDNPKYHDDRMYVFHLSKGSVEEWEGEFVATIYHEEEPEKYIWCLVTYRNLERYPATRVDCFYKKSDALEYMREVEPLTPLVSLNGKSPNAPLTFEKYSEWKKANNMQYFQWKSIYSPGGENARETIIMAKDSFQGIR